MKGSGLATEVCSGRGKVPVADYKVVKYINGDDVDTPFGRRSFYSVCMCPGGQVVLTAQIHRKFESMACHFLNVHLSGQMRHSRLRSHLRISILSISMDFLLELNFRHQVQ